MCDPLLYGECARDLCCEQSCNYMSILISDFLFFNATDDLEQVLDVLGNDFLPDSEPVRKLVRFAAEFGLSGNIWQQWLTYIMMTQENAFTLTCERQPVISGSPLLRMAAGDFELFRELFFEDFTEKGRERLALMTDYQVPFEGYEMTDAGRRISELSEKLAGAEDLNGFVSLMTDHYAAYGTGIFGLYKAFRVSGGESNLKLIPVTDAADVCFDDLIGLEEQKKTLRANTEAFLSGLPANNVLLYGDSGTGKSTSVHALMHDYFGKGLRLVELSKQDRRLLPQVLSMVKKRNYRFIIFLDDLSFEENESDYKELKAMLEGALEKRQDRVLIYATSNRRHLIRETWNDRNDMEYENDIHRSDTMEEKLSLASRFGLSIYYSKPNAKEYLHIVHELSARSGIEMDEKKLNDEARKWELRHGGMSGRTASQLITWIGGIAEKGK